MPLDLLCSEFSFFDQLKLIFTAAVYSYDVYTDGKAAYEYYNKGDASYFAWTLIFILIPPAFTVAANVRYYWLDKRNKLSDEGSDHGRMLSLFRIVCTSLVPLAVYPRFLDYWRRGRRFMAVKQSSDEEERLKYLRLMNEDYQAVSFIKFRESFLESVPQLSLQLWRINVNGYSSADSFERASIFAAVLSLAFSFAGTREFLRDPGSDNDRDESTGNRHQASAGGAHYIGEAQQSTLLGTVILTVAYFCFIASRCIVLCAGRPMINWQVAVAHAIAIVVLAVFTDRANMPLFNLSPRSLRRTVSSCVSYFARLAKALASLLWLVTLSAFSYGHHKLNLSYVLYLAICFLENVYVAEQLMEAGRMLRLIVALFVASNVLFGIFYYFEREINKLGRLVTSTLSEWLSFVLDKLRCVTLMDWAEMKERIKSFQRKSDTENSEVEHSVSPVQ